MRILFTTSNAFIPEHISGQNRTLLELAVKLTEMGHEPVVLAGTASPHGHSKVFCDKDHGFRLFKAEHPIKSLAAICTTLQPDIAVIADGHYEGFIAEFRSLAVPLAVWFFHVEPYFFSHDALNEEILYTASSRFLAKRVSSLFGVNAEILPPFIAAQNYQPQQLGKHVLFVNPVRQKGVELAFALAQQRPNIPFTFLESWGLSPQWRKTCFERAIRCGNIEWRSKTVDMAATFDQARLLLVPRCSEEGFCRLVTEAQLGGTPVLASNRGHLAENVGTGGSVLDIDAGTDAWLAQLDRYFDEDGYYRQVSDEARTHATRAEINEQAVVERLLELLTAHISRHSVRRFRRRPK